jgi:hypothetical protein
MNNFHLFMFFFICLLICFISCIPTLKKYFGGKSDTCSLRFMVVQCSILLVRATSKMSKDTGPPVFLLIMDEFILDPDSN